MLILSSNMVKVLLVTIVMYDLPLYVFPYSCLCKIQIVEALQRQCQDYGKLTIAMIKCKYQTFMLNKKKLNYINAFEDGQLREYNND